MRRLFGFLFFILLTKSGYTQNLDLLKNFDTVNISVIEYDTIILPPDTVFLPPDTIHRTNVIEKKSTPPPEVKSKIFFTEVFFAPFNLSTNNVSIDVQYAPSWSFVTGLNMLWCYKNVFFKTGLWITQLNDNFERSLSNIGQSLSGGITVDNHYTSSLHNHFTIFSIPLAPGLRKEWKKISFSFSAGPNLNYLLSYSVKNINVVSGQLEEHVYSFHQKLVFSLYSGIYMGYNFSNQWELNAGALLGKYFGDEKLYPQKIIDGYSAVYLSVYRKFIK